MSPDRLTHLKQHGKRWPMPTVLVTCTDSSNANLIAATQLAISHWNEAFTKANVKLQLQWHPSQPANINVQMQLLEPGCVAVAMPPNGTASYENEIQINSQVPLAIHASISDTDTEAEQVGKQLLQKGTLDLVKVLMHELGHAIGLKHIADSNAIMFSEYTSKPLSQPNENDLAMVRALYG